MSELVRIDELTAALKLVEWGSCDGCGAKDFCVVCGAYWSDGHADDCQVWIALGRPEPPTERPM